jgi:hypothetical protein
MFVAKAHPVPLANTLGVETWHCHV